MRSTWPSNIRLQQYLNILIFLLAWEPTGVIVNPTVYPPLVVNYDFFSLTVELLNFGSQTLANNIPVGFPSSPIKCETINIYIYLRAVWIAPRDPQVYVREEVECNCIKGVQVRELWRAKLFWTQDCFTYVNLGVAGCNYTQA